MKKNNIQKMPKKLSAGNDTKPPVRCRAARLTNVQKVAAAIGGTVGSFSDGSASWALLEDAKFTICISFDGKGEKFTKISVGEKVYQVVDEKMLAQIVGS